MDQKITHTIKHVPKTRYSLDNQKALPMSKFVPAFISQYVNENPLKYKELKRIFNDDLIEKSHRQIGVLCTKRNMKNGMFLLKQEDILSEMVCCVLLMALNST
jgi:hypothetical protein